MKTTFAAHLVPGAATRPLTADQAERLGVTSDRERSDLAALGSFVYVRGPNAIATVTDGGRYTVALVGHYFLPGGHADSVPDRIVQAFHERSTECFTDLNGSWRALIVDNERGTAAAAADRMGSRRLCFAAASGGRLILGHDSEIVAAIGQLPRNINITSVLQYFYHHFIPSPSTLFDEISALPPAEALTWSRDGHARRRYWTPIFAGQRSDDTVDPGELLVALDDAVGSACPSGRIAAFLSGGLDSSTVVGLASRRRPGAAIPYTIGFDEPKYDETRYARIATDHFGVQLNRYEATPQDVIDTIDEVATAYDEPFGNSSAIPTYLCAKRAAAAGETQMLAGDGGDELFAGNERYRTQQIFEKYFVLPSTVRNHLIEPVFLKLFAGTNFFPIRKVRRYVEQAKLPMPDRLQTYNFLNRHGSDAIFSQQFLEAVDLGAPLQHLRDVYAESSADSIVDRMLYLDWKLTLADNDLRKVTTMCESAGIEVRFPMLDNRLIDLACRIPGDDKMRHGNLRDFYKRAVRSLLPDEIITKSKHGFGLPFGPWFAKSESLRKHMLERLDGLRGRNIVRPDYVDVIRKATLEEHAGYYGEMLWLMCVLESWLDARPQWRAFKL
jgi:asparagine synthase (glutamine-hydrolysing)